MCGFTRCSSANLFHVLSTKWYWSMFSNLTKTHFLSVRCNKKVGQMQSTQKSVSWESVKSVSFGQVRVGHMRVGHLRPSLEVLQSCNNHPLWINLFSFEFVCFYVRDNAIVCSYVLVTDRGILSQYEGILSGGFNPGDLVRKGFCPGGFCRAFYGTPAFLLSSRITCMGVFNQSINQSVNQSVLCLCIMYQYYDQYYVRGGEFCPTIFRGGDILSRGRGFCEVIF